MAQFDVYRNPGGAGFLLDIQSDLLDQLSTRVVAPLLPLAQFAKPASRLNPVFDIAGQRVVMVTQFMAAVPLSELKQRTGKLANRHHEVVAAVDVLLSGI